MTYKKTMLLGLSVGFALTTLNIPSLWLNQVQAEDVKPVVSGAPTRRVGGGTRGIEGAIPTLAALAPNYVGKTLQASPSLYWSLSDVTDKPLKFTLVYSNPLKNGIDPVLETTIEKPVKGIQGLDLAKHNVTLKPGVEYQWSLSIVMDPKQSSQDVVASGVIVRVSEQELPKTVALDKNRPATYEEAQLFYDALQLLVEQITKNPDDKALQQQQLALLEKVGLKGVLN